MVVQPDGAQGPRSYPWPGSALSAGAHQGSSTVRAVAAIWFYALAAGFVALVLTEVIAALAAPRSLWLPLQLVTIPLVAIAAGLACGTAMGRGGSDPGS